MALKAPVENLPAQSTGCSDPLGEEVPAFFTQTGNITRIYSQQAFHSLLATHNLDKEPR